MNGKRIQGLINEIESIIDEAGEEPIRTDVPKDYGTRQAISIGKLAGVTDILRAILKDS